METLKLNIPVIFLIILTANYPQKEGFIYWLLTAYRSFFFFFLSRPSCSRASAVSWTTQHAVKRHLKKPPACILTLTLWRTIAAIIIVARPRAMNPYCVYSITAGSTTRLVWNVARMGPSMYPLWRRTKIQPSRGQRVFVLQIFLQSHQSNIGKSRIKCRYYCVFQTRSGYLFKPEHWHHHLGDLPSFSKETKARLLTSETMLNVCGVSLFGKSFPYVIPATAFM